MKKPSLFGGIVAALLIAAPGVALAQTNGNGNDGVFANNNYRGPEYTNRGAGNASGRYHLTHGIAYANIGRGGYTGIPLPIRTGNNGVGGNGGWFGNNNDVTVNHGAVYNNGNNNANMRPSQRNHLLSDNGDVRANNLQGINVYNDRNNNLGTVNGVLIGRNGVWVVLATNNKKVAVPFQDFVFGDGNVSSHDLMVLPHITEAELNTQPTFRYHLPNYPGYNGNGGGWFSNNGTGNGYGGHRGWLGAHGGGVNGNNG